MILHKGMHIGALHANGHVLHPLTVMATWKLVMWFTSLPMTCSRGDAVQ